MLYSYLGPYSTIMSYLDINPLDELLFGESWLRVLLRVLAEWVMLRE